uniref:Uncharacterized protein n=1 Tax=Nelumbo nucifera TaxID=4432 RepID=A0A822ZNA2_NELNU|nr:TPA_asm: hypothetical protein HUJ06_004483 [Nelumbo nucifera]
MSMNSIQLRKKMKEVEREGSVVVG